MVGLNKLHVGLLGCSHRGGGRLVVVQPIGFTPRAQAHRMALLVRSHYNSGKKNKRKIKETLPPPNARWCKMIKKCGSSSFVKTKEHQWQKNQPLRRNTAYSPFYTTICKVSPLLYLSLAKRRLNALDEEQVKQLVRAVNRLEMRETREQPPAGGLLANWLTSLAS